MNSELKYITTELKKRKNIAAAVLFGSHASGKTKPWSDIDVAVVLSRQNVKSEEKIATKITKNSDISLFHKLPVYIQFDIVKNGKPLFVKDKKAFNETKFKTLIEFHEMADFYENYTKKVMDA